MPRRQSPRKHYPDPDCEYDLFDLGALPDPPDDWTFYGYGKEAFGNTSRIFSSAVTKVLIDFHCWGIEPDVQGRSKKESRLMALRKLSYYQADQHRPPTLNDFFDFSRDAGPRLLRTDLHPMPKPISRFYPTVPDPGTDPLGEGIPPSYAQQFAYPSGPRSRTTVPGQPTLGPWHTVAGDPSQNTQLSVGLDIDNTYPTPPDITPPGSVAMIPPLVLQPSAIPPSAPLPGQSQAFPAVVESVERALLGLRYRLLDRHPQAAANIPRPYLTAASEWDLLHLETRAFVLTSHVRLSRSGDGSDFVLDPNGLIYAFRGRGPVSRRETSAVDCVIVAGKFLDVGSTIIDCASEMLGHMLTETEREFRTMADTDWAVLSPEESMAKRDAFLDIITRNHGRAIPVSEVWRKCTQSFSQFHISYTEQFVKCCTCSHPFPPELSHVVTSVVAPPHFESDHHGVTMEALLNRFFAYQLSQECGHCRRRDTIVRERRFNILPFRMVVQPHYSASPRNHTSDNIKIKYCDEHGQTQIATYRWLGGVYCNKNETIRSQLGLEDPYRYRTYWTDSGRGEKETGELRMYDGMHNLGLIVGTIPAAHPDEPIPESWCRGVSVPLLFYEQVLNPDKEALEVAKQTVGDMLYAAENDVLILQKHQPWASTDHQRLSGERRLASNTEAGPSSTVLVERRYDEPSLAAGGSASVGISPRAPTGQPSEEGIKREANGQSPFPGWVPEQPNNGPVDSETAVPGVVMNPQGVSETTAQFGPNLTPSAVTTVSAFPEYSSNDSQFNIDRSEAADMVRTSSQFPDPDTQFNPDATTDNADIVRALTQFLNQFSETNFAPDSEPSSHDAPFNSDPSEVADMVRDSSRFLDYDAQCNPDPTFEAAGMVRVSQRFPDTSAEFNSDPTSDAPSTHNYLFGPAHAGYLNHSVAPVGGASDIPPNGEEIHNLYSPARPNVQQSDPGDQATYDGESQVLLLRSDLEFLQAYDCSDNSNPPCIDPSSLTREGPDAEKTTQEGENFIEPSERARGKRPAGDANSNATSFPNHQLYKRPRPN